MPFIRLSDNYIYHPKFLALSASAFRLWHEGLAYCRQQETDGRISSGTVQGFRYYKAPRVTELATPFEHGAHPLWERIEGFGYQVHDYLFWNLSKEETQKDRDGATERMRRLRGRRKATVTPSPLCHGALSDAVTPPLGDGERSPNVPDTDRDRIGSFRERERERKPAADDLGERAGRLIKHYANWYTELRNGAKLRLIGSPLEFQDACSLCEAWDDARLQELARIVLITDDEFISRTDRSFKIFAMKASWADDRLRQVEKANQVTV